MARTRPSNVVGQIEGADTQRDIQTVTLLAQAILKRERQRVKIGT
jgi:hypothetical protein